MTKIADISASRNGSPNFICDFSPPRGAAYTDIELARTLDAHCLSVPYNPGKSVYANSAMAAHSVRARTGKNVAFTIATRDMNILAAQSLLLGAALLGLENVIVVGGDDFTTREMQSVKAVAGYTPTALIRSIAAMNEGIDFRGRALSAPTDFCIGAAIDLNRSHEAEATLTRRKIAAGANFLVTQPGFTPDSPLLFLQAYERAYSARPAVPIFFGIQMIASGGRSFTPVPQSVLDQLNEGIPPEDIAASAIDRFLSAGIADFYLMPPILPRGVRDYRSAQSVMSRFKAHGLSH